MLITNQIKRPKTQLILILKFLLLVTGQLINHLNYLSLKKLNHVWIILMLFTRYSNKIIIVSLNGILQWELQLFKVNFLEAQKLMTLLFQHTRCVLCTFLTIQKI